MANGGKVSLIGHSLGSAILFDILCRQKEDSKVGRHNIQSQTPVSKAQEKEMTFDFDVEEYVSTTLCKPSNKYWFQSLITAKLLLPRKPHWLISDAERKACILYTLLIFIADQGNLEPLQLDINRIQCLLKVP